MWHCNVDYKNDTKTIWANIYYRIRKSCRIWSIDNLLHIPPKMLCNLIHTLMSLTSTFTHSTSSWDRDVAFTSGEYHREIPSDARSRTWVCSGEHSLVKLRSDVVRTYVLYLNFDRVDGSVKNDARNSSGQRKTDSNGLWREGQQCCCIRGWVGNQTLNAHRLVTGPEWRMADEGGLWQGCCVCGWAETLWMITDPSDGWWTRVGSMLEIVRNPSLYMMLEVLRSS